jgi:hypothetical protein
MKNSKLVVYQIPNLQEPYHYANMVRLWRAAAEPQKFDLGLFRPVRLILKVAAPCGQVRRARHTWPPTWGRPRWNQGLVALPWQKQ